MTGGDGNSLGTRLDGNVRRFPPGGDSRSRHPSGGAKAAVPAERDPFGKMALFSTAQRQPFAGTFLVDCSACHRETPVSPVQLVRAAMPFSLHFPLVRKYHSFMRCPACGRRTWVRVRWQP